MESLDDSQTNNQMDLNTYTLSNIPSCESLRSDNNKDDTRSTGSKDSADTERKQFPTFTNEVVVIRPESFYENEDC